MIAFMFNNVFIGVFVGVDEQLVGSSLSFVINLRLNWGVVFNFCFNFDEVHIRCSSEGGDLNYFYG